MRDKDRIEPFLEKFKELWLLEDCTDIRFGQMIYNLVTRTRKTMYNMEENEWMEIIQKEIDKRVDKK